jgi:hypothetical protein
MHRTSILSLLILLVMAIGACGPAKPQTSVSPETPSSSKRNPRPYSPESSERSVIAISDWDPSGKHTWAVAPACNKDQVLFGEAKSVGALAEEYLSQKGLLPAKFHFCVSRVGTDQWEAVCIPDRELMNSPVTVLVASGEVQKHYFSDAADPTTMIPEESSKRMVSGPQQRPTSTRPQE